MKRITGMVVSHRHHIIGAIALSLAIYCALVLGQYMGLGGLRIQPGLLLLGLLVAEAGRSLTCFGAKLKHGRLEYAGVFTQGLAWWIWTINLEFIDQRSGWSAVFHLVCPAILIGALPAVIHYATKHSLEKFGYSPDDCGCGSTHKKDKHADPT